MDQLNLSGVLTLRYFKNGIWIKTETANNLIVNGGYAAILNMISGTNDLGIAKVQVGTSAAAAAVTDTDITSPLDLTILTRTVASKKITFTFEFGADQGNGTDWNEFGLICGDGSLFSRKKWPTITKISDLTINGTWEINL